METTNTLSMPEEPESAETPTADPNEVTRHEPTNDPDSEETPAANPTETMRQQSANGSESQQTCWKVFKKWRIEHCSFYFFAIFVGICSLICLGIQIFNYFSFRETKKEILSIYKPNIRIETRIRDSLFYHDIDSLISPFCATAKHKFHLHGLIDKSVKFAIKQVDCDSLVNHKVEILQQDTKNLLDLQYHKIEHEFQIMQVWCGILTVVFLIFSFYSLFKADDIVQQGKIGLKELDNIKNRGDKKIHDFDSTSNAAIKDYNTKIDVAINNMNLRNRNRIEEINNLIKSKANELSIYVNDKQKEIETAYKKTEIEWQQKIGEMKTNYETLDSQFQLLQQQINNIKYTSNVNNSKKE